MSSPLEDIGKAMVQVSKAMSGFYSSMVKEQVKRVQQLEEENARRKKKFDGMKLNNCKYWDEQRQEWIELGEGEILSMDVNEGDDMRMGVLTDGNVGIGSVAPAQELNVQVGGIVSKQIQDLLLYGDKGVLASCNSGMSMSGHWEDELKEFITEDDKEMKRMERVIKLIKYLKKKGLIAKNISAIDLLDIQGDLMAILDGRDLEE